VNREAVEHNQKIILMFHVEHF